MALQSPPFGGIVARKDGVRQGGLEVKRMSELDKRIMDNQLKLLKAMDEDAKRQYLAFSEGMLAAKQQSGEKKD